MITITCPKCGTENSSNAMNCKQCRINLKFALEHPEEIQRIRKIDETPLPTEPSLRAVGRMEYPLELSFKILALVPQISVTDARGRLVFYVRRVLSESLKTEATVFADAQQTQPLYTINADRVLGFSARYHFADVSGMKLGSVKREGTKSLWKAHYDIFEGEAVVMTIREENPWGRVLDGLFSAIPIIGLSSGYVFHPAFLVSRPDGTVVARLEKQPSFLESSFRIDKEAEMEEEEETRMLLSLLMMILVERARG